MAFAYDKTDPATSGAAVTPNDSVDLPATTRALWIGGAGDVKVTLQAGVALTLSAVPAGSMLPLQVTRVWATGTSATLITALW